MKQPLEMTMYVEVDSGGNDLFKEGLHSKMLLYSVHFRYIEVE